MATQIDNAVYKYKTLNLPINQKSSILRVSNKFALLMIRLFDYSNSNIVFGKWI